ncbi:glycosyltransferase family A protein [Aureimonas jatrophae]|uniref:glycosyltransferase family 2 protein n=1 Tax=Aureimonas jatrophae TaxID=1166073 RepID=UPI003139CA8F
MDKSADLPARLHFIIVPYYDSPLVLRFPLGRSVPSRLPFAPCFETSRKNVLKAKPAFATRPALPVAVVIPFYNGSDTIERAVRSVLEQSAAPAEFVVVDDGSRAEEGAALDALAERLGFRVLHTQNGGQGAARNAGVASTTAPYICFLDQDDFFLGHHIRDLSRAVPRNDPHFGWVYGELFEAEGDGSVVRTSIVTHHARHPKTDVIDLIKGDMFVLPSAALVSREAFEAVGGFDPQFTGYEDDDLFLRIFRAGYTNHFTPKAVTVWCIHSESTSYSPKMALSRFRYFRKLVGMFPDDEAKGRFFVRDMIIPRFQEIFLSEAIEAATRREGKYAANRETYLRLAADYVAIIRDQPTVSGFFKWRLGLHLRALDSRHARRIYHLRPTVTRLRAAIRGLTRPSR